MRIDAHHHAWDLTARDQPWIRGDALAPIRRTFTLAELAPQARRAGISHTVLVQSLPDADETRELLALTAGHALPVGVVGWTDLCASGVADAVARLREQPGGESLLGIRHGVQSEQDPYWLSRPRVRAGLAALADAGLAYDLLVRPHQLPTAVDTARALGSLTLVLDHLGQPPSEKEEWEKWNRLVRDLAAEPNTFCKLSGLATTSPPALRAGADAVLDAFGPGRVMFGSDWPVCLLGAPYADVVRLAEDLVAGLTPAEHAEVFGGTAIRAYAPPHCNAPQTNDVPGPVPTGCTPGGEAMT